MSAIVGIDPSLTGTGIAIVQHPQNVSGRNIPKLLTVAASGSQSDTLAQRSIRIGKQRDNILRTLGGLKVRLVMIEQLPFKQPKFSGLYQERCALYFDLVRYLVTHRIPVVEVSVTAIKLFATGDGKSDKAGVMTSMRELWPGAPISNDNESDALAVASIGSMHLGWYEPELPCHYSPKVVWPNGVTA